MPTKGFNEAYKEWRNQARKFSLDSMLGCAMISLRKFESERGLRRVQSAPWNTALLIKWVCQDGMNFSLRQISMAQFDELRQRLWSFPEDVAEISVGPESGLLLMRRIMRPQIGFQQRPSISFMRSALLMSRLEDGHALRRLFLREMRLDPLVFLEFGYATYSAVISGRKDIPFGWYMPLVERHGIEAARNFFSLVSANRAELCSYFGSLLDPEKPNRRASELHEFPELSRYPFLRSQGYLQCWDSALLFRGMEFLVHKIMAGSGQEYSDRFGRVFEAHVVSEALSTGIEFHDEDEIKEWVGENVRVPDGVFCLRESNVFLESKAGIFSEPVMIAGTKDAFKSKARALHSALAQASQCAELLFSLQSENFREKNNYLIVVTNLELSIGRGDNFEKMLPDNFLTGAGYRREAIPLENIYIISIDDYERLMGLVRLGQCELADVLKKCVQRDHVPKTARLLFGNHLDDLGLGRPVSLVIEKGRRELETRFSTFLRH
jgi:hypothetical protein